MRLGILLLTTVLAAALGCDRGDKSPRSGVNPDPLLAILDLTTVETTKVCEVHGTLLRPVIVPIAYGLLEPDDEFDKAWRTSFPHGVPALPGGCVVMPQKQARVLACEKCQVVYEEWSRARQAAAGRDKTTEQSAGPNRSPSEGSR